MDIYSVISRKRDGGKLSADEIKYFVQSFTNGKIADYQASALLMARKKYRLENKLFFS